MQEYWINVYEGLGLGSKWKSLNEAKAGAIRSGLKTLYRLHIKMKLPQLAGRFQRISIRETSILDGYRS